MKLTEYIKDKILLLILQVCFASALAGFLHMTGYPADNLVLILLCWVLVLVLWIGYGYYHRKRYFCSIEELLQQVDKRYLLGELMPESYHLEDKLYREIIRRSNKSVIERIRRIEDEQKDYREYIESWVHEVKAPITSIALICENNKENSDVSRRISMENQKIENYVDMALYYAKSDEVYKDYIICETDLQEIAVVVLNRNKLYLIQNQIQAEIDCKNSVYTDRKWIAFILNQIVLNSTKYRRDSDAHIWIFTEKYEHGVRLVVKDNGIGIREEEIARIFEKGFTGSNGRKTERSTGMGLYLCRKLCHRLGIQIYARSWEGKGTEIVLEFPISSYIPKL